jgi:hypothetical protein
MTRRVDACRSDPRIVRAIGGKGQGFAVLDAVQGGSLFIGLSTRLARTRLFELFIVARPVVSVVTGRLIATPTSRIRSRKDSRP